MTVRRPLEPIAATGKPAPQARSSALRFGLGRGAREYHCLVGERLAVRSGTAHPLRAGDCCGTAGQRWSIKRGRIHRARVATVTTAAGPAGAGVEGRLSDEEMQHPRLTSNGTRIANPSSLERTSAKGPGAGVGRHCLQADALTSQEFRPNESLGRLTRARSGPGGRESCGDRNGAVCGLAASRLGSSEVDLQTGADIDVICQTRSLGADFNSQNQTFAASLLVCVASDGAGAFVNS
jgi:hypothetical protein